MPHVIKMGTLVNGVARDGTKSRCMVVVRLVPMMPLDDCQLLHICNRRTSSIQLAEQCRGYNGPEALLFDAGRLSGVQWGNLAVSETQINVLTKRRTSKH